MFYQMMSKYLLSGGMIFLILCFLDSTLFVDAGISCLSNPCLHGICIDDVNSTYSCYCVDGFTGVQCQTNWDECWSGPCQNGGTCLDGIASYNCSCSDGFIGDNCEVNYNECESNPCSNNGTCIDLANGYVCSCLPGYSGTHCELDEAVCNSTEEIRCHNGGQCVEGPGFKFNCKCLPGWTGAKCEDDVDECSSNPCQNGGVCIDIHADYMCACTFGFTGKSCEVQIEFCDENSCSNNAICVVEDNERVCYCVPDYHGEKCELQYDECLLGPRCMNGGSCIDGIDNFTCSCPPRLTGTLCECLILDDGSLECNYVSPTPESNVQETTMTTIYHDVLTTEEISTRSYTTEKQAIETIIDTTSTSEDALTTDNYLTSEQTTVLNIDDTTTQTEPPEPTTQTVTIESENIVTQFTEKCVDGCDETTSNEPSSTLKDVQNTITTITSITPEETEKIDTTVTSVTDVSEVVTSDLTTKVDTATERIFTDSPEETLTDLTTKVDTATERIFTDSPEETLTDLTTISSQFTTDAIDITSYENITTTYTTMQMECSDSLCHDHGACINSLHGLRCHCAFNYGGKFCEEEITITAAAFGGNSFLTHKLTNDTSVYIEFSARTLITDGQLMYVDIAKGVYMQLYMVAGLLKFKFSCGYQTMLLSELRTFVNKGFSMKIETRLDIDINKQHCNATLHVNDTVAMSGGQVANISHLSQNATLYLGNAPNMDVENKPFIGCIRDLTVNNEKREIFGNAVDASGVSECSSLTCLSAPCYNGGTCRENQENYTCACSNGWIGDHCEISVCDHNPCQFGGSCVRHPGSGFLCLCPYGKHGIFCEYNVEITRASFSPIPGGMSSYMKYSSSQAVTSERFDLRFRFQTSDMDQISLLAFIGQNGHHDSRSQHLAVTFVKGYVMLTWNMGSGARRIFTPRAINTRRGGHWVRIGRRGRTAWLSVDGQFNVTGNAPGSNMKMTVLPYLYIGGHPSLEFNELPHDLPLHEGWRGCIWEVSVGRPLSARGVGQCGVAHCSPSACNGLNGVCIHHPATYGCICNEGWFGATCTASSNPCDKADSACRGRCVMTAASVALCDCPYGFTGENCDIELIPTDVLFTGIRSYVRLQPRVLSSVSLALEMEIKPGKVRGLIFFAETPHFYTALSLQGALLEYRWMERISGLSSVVSSSVVLSVGRWHSIRAGRYGARLYVWVEGTLTAAAMLAHAVPHTADNATILLGGAEDLSSLPFDVMSGPPESYTGCIRNLHVNNVLIPLEKHNIEDAMNLGDCDGTPCGGEICGGGSCVVESGSARCVCGSNTKGSDNIGTRCRRNAPCSSFTCKLPRGICRRGKCVCAAGYYGELCEQNIDVVVPQFSGESLLLLDYKSHGHLHLEQPQSEQMLNYVTLNFTTAEPNGLILWITTNEFYLGIGLSNGHLKLAWPSKENKHTLWKSGKYNDSTSEIFPNLGLLADAEWHVIVLNITNNITSLKIDDEVVHTMQNIGRVQRTKSFVKIYLGGVLDRESEAKNIFQHNFNGCITDISTSKQTFLNNFTQFYSENIQSCQLFP